MSRSVWLFVKNRPDAAPWLFLVEAQKGRKTGLRVEPDILIQSGAALYGPNTLCKGRHRPPVLVAAAANTPGGYGIRPYGAGVDAWHRPETAAPPFPPNIIP